MPSRGTSTTAEGSTRAPARRGGHGGAGMLIFCGIILLGFAALAITLQTQTNESYISGTQKTNTVIQAEWQIWLQIPRLMFGDVVPCPPITTNDLPMIFLGQGVEIVYVSLLSSAEIALLTGRKLGRLLFALVFIILLGIILYDFWTDLAYGNVPQPVHISFAIFITFAVGFFPTWGIALITHGWRRL